MLRQGDEVMRKECKRPPGLIAIAVGVVILALAFGSYRLLMILAAVALIYLGLCSARRM